MKSFDFYLDPGDVVQVADIASKFFACCVQVVGLLPRGKGVEGYIIAPFGEAFKVKFRFEQVEFVGSAKLFFVK